LNPCIREIRSRKIIMKTQKFKTPGDGDWRKLDFLPGVDLLPLAEPVPHGSIHRARLKQGTIIPPHTHPADEFVLVLSGSVETGGRKCEAGTFWTTPAETRQGPHVAITDVELLTVRLGPMGEFET
jgi:quercetin dioxygenase-like cupin family protein